jgi:hypothetical protein
VLPTLLYTWQYYDLVDKIANPDRSCCAIWFRSAFVTATGFGTVVATLLFDYFNALESWY